MFSSSSVARLTRHLLTSHLSGATRSSGTRSLASLAAAAGKPTITTGSSTATTPVSHQFIAMRSLATDGKDASTSTSSKAKSTSATTTEPSEATDIQQPFLQHQEWVKFQQSIRVDGFQTGQVTAAHIMKKSKGGKQARNRKARELELLQQLDPNYQAPSSGSSSSSKFPAIRYSPEETQELLQLAFKTLPKREGKRGTRNLKRQAVRWKAVRKIRAKYKQQIQAAHERRMEHRQWKREETKAVKEGAPALCHSDAEYQAQILKRWAATMFSSSSSSAPAEKTPATATSGHLKEGKMASTME